ncbi:CDP-alcohol phosphatidyltransferase family protein [Actinomadura parmotrematis]|uniref:CDP-alcohol phosphatidyltransferase family protein n=1 Tax=Actinomadura parmotrematis TaxID=2864039 RepID=A0ABS7FMP8_9ACTN|nr:CDP-alcohol phosphatidyltransferase family protein [Actinomadura parmotrematis]MBW8481601.1 CDP-alcohol phosphatidyltransferase family protein [Actinomadura parmotrematis]
MSAFADALVRLKSAQKTAKGAPAYSRFVNRKLGRLLAAASYTAGLTPNQVTGISALFTFTGIALIALVDPAPWLGVAVCLALVVGYAFDAADGQLARLRGGGSKAGEYLDHMVDSLKISALHGAVLVSFYRFFDLDRAAWLLVPLGFTVVAAVMFFGMILKDLLARAHRAATGEPAPPATAPSALRSLLVVPTDYGLLCAAFALLGAKAVFLPLYTLIFAGNLLFLLAAGVKWYREVAGLDRPAAPAPAGRAAPEYQR